MNDVPKPDITKIAPYKPGPTAPPPPEPPPWVQPRMSPSSPVVEAAVWRVKASELGHLAWLPGALAKEHPRLSPEGISSWLKAAILDRSTLLIRTQRVVGLFEAVTNVLDPEHPHVWERWVRSQDKANDETPLLYKFARDWALSIRAGRFTWNMDSDAAMTNHVNPHLSDVRVDLTVQKETIYTMQMK